MAAEFSWTPPIVVLTMGAVAGAVLVATRSRSKAQGASPASMKSEASDLQRRYDTLIRRLAEGATPEERAAIELQAAQILMEMETPSKQGERKGKTRSDAPLESAPVGEPAPVRQASAWAGFLYGVLTMGVLGALFYFASRGSTERAEGGSPTGGNTMGSASAQSPQMTAAEAAEIQTLEEAVRKAPRDIGQRIELTRAYLRQHDLMKVFDQTKAVLEIEPGNPHALTYQALVRVAMGQSDQAEAMLIEAIKKDPKIEDAYIHLAIARIQLGNRTGAEEAIQQGQREFPADREQLAQVFQQIASAADGQGDPATTSVDHPEGVAPAAAADAPSARASASLVVVIDLPKGVVIPDGAMLFVIVREAGFETGPPVAVKRVPAANFPVTVTLSEADSMGGESLPGLIRLDARIDRDGNPLTKDPGDPVASEDNVRPGAGQIFLVLTSGKG